MHRSCARQLQSLSRDVRRLQRVERQRAQSQRLLLVASLVEVLVRLFGDLLKTVCR